MSPMQQYGQKRDRIKFLMERQHFTDYAINAILAGTTPHNVDAMLDQLERWDQEDSGGPPAWAKRTE